MSSFTCSFSKETEREPFVPEFGSSPLSASKEPGSDNQKNNSSPASLPLAGEARIFTPSRRVGAGAIAPLAAWEEHREVLSSHRNDRLLTHTANSTLCSAKANRTRRGDQWSRWRVCLHAVAGGRLAAPRQASLSLGLAISILPLSNATGNGPDGQASPLNTKASVFSL